MIFFDNHCYRIILSLLKSIFYAFQPVKHFFIQRIRHFNLHLHHLLRQFLLWNIFDQTAY